MKMKSLLLGSAAAMIFAPVASAADAIIAAEPEPVEYVRVCDAFGAGYFYIPGTEICLKVGGEARLRVTANKHDAVLNAGSVNTTAVSYTPVGITGGNQDSYSTAVRARVNFQAKQDTELGVLESYIRLQGENDGGGDGAVSVDQAWVQLNNLFFGYHESAWVTSTNGGASGFGAHGIFDGSFGYQQRNLIQYQFTGANWFGAISVEDDMDGTSYVPDVVGRLGFVVGGATIFGVVGYDQDNGITNTALTTVPFPAGGINPAPAGINGVFATSAAAGAGTSEVGVKLGLNTDIGSAGNLRVQGFYATGSTAYGANLGFLGQAWTPEWSVLASYSHAVSSEVDVYANGQYFSDFYWAGSSTKTGVDAWRVAGGGSWSPVDNFAVTAEVQYVDIGTIGIPVADAVADNWNVVFEMKRTF